MSITGIVRDENSYFESSNRWLNMSQPGLVTWALQAVFPLFEALWGAGPFDGVRLSLTHVNLQEMMTKVCVHVYFVSVIVLRIMS